MFKLSPGEHELKILFSLNGQQFHNTGKKLLFDAPEQPCSFDQILKLEDHDFKNKGRPKKK
jgi:hypothetical protein